LEPDCEAAPFVAPFDDDCCALFPDGVGDALVLDGDAEAALLLYGGTGAALLDCGADFTSFDGVATDPLSAGTRACSSLSVSPLLEDCCGGCVALEV